MMARFEDARHADAAIEEWVFAAWTADGATGVVSGHRVVGRVAWYWAALARVGRPLLHVTDFHVPVRADPFIVKGEALWAEHHCVAPLEQWSIGNETYAASLDDADEALGRAYGDPTPIAFDLEWYATAPPTRSNRRPAAPAPSWATSSTESSTGRSTCRGNPPSISSRCRPSGGIAGWPAPT